MDRRSFLRAGLAGIFAAAAGPGVLSSGVIMPVRQLVVRDPFGQRGWVPWKIENRAAVLNEDWMAACEAAVSDAHLYGTGAHRAYIDMQDNLRMTHLPTVQLYGEKSWP